MDTSAERELLTVLAHAATLTTWLPAAEVVRLATGILERETASPAHVHTALPLLVTILAGADEVAPVLPWLETALDKARMQQADIEHALIRAEQALALLYVGHFLDATNRLLRASVAAAAGDFRQALDHNLDCGRRLDRAGWHNPVLFPWRTNAALLHHRLGNTDSAVGYAEDARALAAQWGAPFGIGRALRTLGHITQAQPGTELLREAVTALETSGNVLELANAQLQLGERSHLAGDPTATDIFRRAHTIALDSGVPWLAAQAGRRLKSAGGALTTATRRGLTKSESRVVGLATSDHSNQKIAEILEISRRAVEKHLTNSFRKLGIRRRIELAGALAVVPVSGYEMLSMG